MIGELCRLCGVKHDYMRSIFDEFSEVKNINFKIYTVLHINIKTEDVLPTKICTECANQLENAFYFISICQETQTHLQKLYELHTVKQSEVNLEAITELTKDDTFFEKNFIESTKHESSNLNSIVQLNSNVFHEYKMSKKNYDNFDIQKNNTSGSIEKCFDSNLELLMPNMKNISDNENNSQILKKLKQSCKNVELRKNDIKTCSENNQNKKLCERKNSSISTNNDESNDHGAYETDYDEDLFEDNVNDSDYDEYCEQNKKMGTPKKQKFNKFLRKTSNSVASVKFKRKSRISISSNNISQENELPKESDDSRQPCKMLKEKKRLTCATCKMTFTQELTYEEHLNVHTGNRPFSCKLCEASFRKRQELNQHLRTIHSEKQFKCSLCDHVAKHKGKLTEHMKSVHEKPFVCDLCNYRTGEKGKIMQHIANKHTFDLSYVCEICGNGFKTKNSLQTHRQNIHFPEPKICQTCGTVCPSLARYSAHIFRCGKEKKRYPCEKCGKTYVNKEILKDHMNKHLNIRPYKCDICGKEFFQRNRLDTHKYVHRGPVYRCEVCSQSFNRKDNMKNHMKKHFYKSMRYNDMIVTAV